jgi:hypothetical protein
MLVVHILEAHMQEVHHIHLVMVEADMEDIVEVAMVVEDMEEDIVDDKKTIVYYFWLVFYFIKNLPEIIYLYLYREYLYLKLIIIELFDL